MMERRLNQGNKGGVKSRERREVRRKQTWKNKGEENWNKKEDNTKFEKDRSSDKITWDKQEMWISDKKYSRRENDQGWWDHMDRQSRRKVRAKEREKECQEEDWSNIKIQNANKYTWCSFCNNSMSNVLHYCYGLGEYVLIDHKHCHVYNTKTKRVKDILDPKNNVHNILQNRIEMAKDMQDIAKKRDVLRT